MSYPIMLSKSLPIVGLSILSYYCALSSAQPAAPTIQTTYGPVYGTTINNVYVYGSIPFAKPPVGDLRFQAPQEPVAWTTPLNVSAYAPACPQLKLDETLYIGQEDCLYLAVYIPIDAYEAAKATGTLLPVMQYIYGGAFILGDTQEFGFYNGINLALRRGVIVVAGNYRVGPFGFTALPALQKEDPNGSTGNAAMQDQRIAMQWTQNNIQYFGGNSSSVLIFGESAGGFSIAVHMTSPASSGLFHAAVMESGSCDSPAFFQPLSIAVNFSLMYADALGCNQSDSTAQLSCLRSLSTSDLMKSILSWFNPNWPYNTTPSFGSYPTLREYYKETTGLSDEYIPTIVPSLTPMFPWGPAIDGTEVGLMRLPYQSLLHGNYNKVPWIIGTNRNEGSIFIPLLPLIVANTSFPPAGASDLEGFVVRMLNQYNVTLAKQLAVQAVNFYNISNYPGNNWGSMGTDMLTHYFFTCSARRAARAASKNSTVFYYQFSYALDWIEYLLLGDYHSSELDFVFNNPWPPILHDFSANDQNMSDIMTLFWSNMAANGDPNVPYNNNEIPPIIWPQYDAVADVNIQLELPVGLTASLLEKQCDFWDTVFAQTTGKGL